MQMFHVDSKEDPSGSIPHIDLETPQAAGRNVMNEATSIEKTSEKKAPEQLQHIEALALASILMMTVDGKVSEHEIDVLYTAS